MTGNIRTDLIGAGAKVSVPGRVQRTTYPTTSAAVPAYHVASTTTLGASCVLSATSNRPLGINQRGNHSSTLGSIRADCNSAMEAAQCGLNVPSRSLPLAQANRKKDLLTLANSLRENQVAIDHLIWANQSVMDRTLQQIYADLRRLHEDIVAYIISTPWNKRPYPVREIFHRPAVSRGIDIPSATPTPMPRGVVSKLKRKSLLDSSSEPAAKCRRKSTLAPAGRPLATATIEMRVGEKKDCSYDLVRGHDANSQYITTLYAPGCPPEYGMRKTADEIEEWINQIPSQPVRRKLF